MHRSLNKQKIQIAQDIILETEEIQDMILEKINQIDTYLQLQAKASPALATPLPVTQPSSTSSLSTTLPHGNTESNTVEGQLPSTAANTELTAVTSHRTSPIVASVSLTSSQSQSEANSYPQASSRLPKLTLPIFTGDPLSWQTFWDSFSAAVDTSPTLGAIQKFSYLRAQLQEDAARTIAGLHLTETNYSHSVSLLKERFGQPNKIQNTHMQALLELPGPTNELSSLRMFHDSVEAHIRGLSSLGVPKESYGALLVPIVIAKLSVRPWLESIAIWIGLLMTYKQ